MITSYKLAQFITKYLQKNQFCIDKENIDLLEQLEK